MWITDDNYSLLFCFCLSVWTLWGRIFDILIYHLLNTSNLSVFRLLYQSVWVGGWIGKIFILAIYLFSKITNSVFGWLLQPLVRCRRLIVKFMIGIPTPPDKSWTETCENASTTHSVYTFWLICIHETKKDSSKSISESKSRFRVLGRGNAGLMLYTNGEERMEVVVHNAQWFLLYYLSLVVFQYSWHLSLSANRFKQAEWRQDLELGRKSMRSLYTCMYRFAPTPRNKITPRFSLVLSFHRPLFFRLKSTPLPVLNTVMQTFPSSRLPK